MSRTTIRASLAVVVLAAAVLVLVLPAGAASSRVGFGFNASSISGFGAGQGGEAFLTGGGAFDPAGVSDPANGFVHAAGGFRCVADVKQGPLAGCLQGQGVRWDSEQLLASTGFKCTGAAAERLKTALTDDHTVVIKADFARAGDGSDESLHAKLIVSDHDLAPDVDGIQNVWIEQVGCGSANVNFSS
jgi:hypothetical protein